jgi:nucleotide-binding universal stress UspA family protein
MERETIVVGFKVGEPGRMALEAAISEARRREARLIVVHSMPGGQMSEDEVAELHENEKALEEIDRQLSEQGIEHETESYVRGMSPAEDLAEAAESMGASLLVIGHRKRSKTGKYVLGSDTQEILLRVACPVLVVRS